MIVALYRVVDTTTGRAVGEAATTWAAADRLLKHRQVVSGHPCHLMSGQIDASPGVERLLTATNVVRLRASRQAADVVAALTPDDAA